MVQVTWNDVKSSNIKQIAYHDENLLVKFKSDTVYKYADVPTTTYDALMESVSKGKFLTTDIKNKFKYTKIVDILK